MMTTMHSSPKPKMHLVIGKIYSDGCIHCVMMSKAWDEMIKQIQEDMHLINDTSDRKPPLSKYSKYVSNNGDKVVEIIEIESEVMDEELPYVQKEYSPALELQGGFPTIFKIRNKNVSYYGGERTAEKMKQWCISGSSGKKASGGYTRRKRRNNKTKKNKTRVRYTRACKR